MEFFSEIYIKTYFKLSIVNSMVSITQKYAPIVFIFAIAFLMIAPLQVIDVFAAIPSTMSVAANNIQVQSYDDRKVTLTWTPVAVPGVGFYDYELQVGARLSFW